MDIEIRDKFNKYMDNDAPKQIKRLFDELDEGDGIMLQSCFEDFAKSVLEQRSETRPHETIVNALTSRKQHWMSESRRLVMEKPDSEEAEDATHMYGVYIDAVDDMKTFLKEGH